VAIKANIVDCKAETERDVGDDLGLWQRYRGSGWQ
jgi:hypothetical protein